MARSAGVLFHTDAAQAAGKIAIDVAELGVDLMSLSAHKMYGPKGVGALYVRADPAVRLLPLFDGGGHERNLRSGTLPVPLIVGFGKACSIAAERMKEESLRLQAMASRLFELLSDRLDFILLNGHPTRRLPGNLNVAFAGVNSDALISHLLKELAISSGSACASAKAETSYVLRAIGLPEELVTASIRFGIGRFNTDEEVEYVAERVAETVLKLRKLNPLWRDRAKELWEHLA